MSEIGINRIGKKKLLKTVTAAIVVFCLGWRISKVYFMKINS